MEGVEGVEGVVGVGATTAAGGCSAGIVEGTGWEGVEAGTTGSAGEEKAGCCWRGAEGCCGVTGWGDGAAGCRGDVGDGVLGGTADGGAAPC